MILPFFSFFLRFLADPCRCLQFKTQPAKDSSSKPKKEPETQRKKIRCQLSFEAFSEMRKKFLYGAPEDYHDDCVIALALAAWQLKRNAPPGIGADFFPHEDPWKKGKIFFNPYLPKVSYG